VQFKGRYFKTGMEHILQLFIFLPFISLLIAAVIPKKEEKYISQNAVVTILVQLLAILIYTVYWVINGRIPLDIDEVTILKTANYRFFIDFYFDALSAVFLIIGAFLTFLVTAYSRYYMHREKGYKRFYYMILFFFLGYNIVVLAGNFETLFIGWEIIGVASFLLIAFYRERHFPVSNAFKVYSIYRIGDIGIILAMWASHHLWHDNITFLKLNNYELLHEHLQRHSATGIFISIAILLAASVKSAQLPFSSWLPRAMEGPTPSSAIFYGSLSVHLGVFLMLRTFPFWEHQLIIRVLIVLMGAATSIVATFIARVQTSVKSQIAYASISQIGLMFIEIALGLKYIALIHFVGNAFLRTYQLLISPSVVSYMIRQQFYNFTPHEHTFEDTLPKKIEHSLYILSIKEFKLEAFMNYIFWSPLKKIGKALGYVPQKKLYGFIVFAFAAGVVLVCFKQNISASSSLLGAGGATVAAAIGMILVFKAYSERENPFAAWLLIICNHFFIVIAILLNDIVDYKEIIIYISGVLLAGLFGFLILMQLKKRETQFHLNQHLGHIYEHKKLAFLFLLAALGITGFPITTTFVGEDLVFTHIHSHQILLALFVSQSFIIGGLSSIRIYTRLFLGTHCKSYHELPYQNG
jgi:NADH:ubiquinone oxidoreductase subunit 5 (subunit L)/multisubunit Na+/H+ antiporter MnhA subunit